jgi:hypothetical protein
MTIPRNLSFLAEGASSTGVLGLANGGTNFTASSNSITSASTITPVITAPQYDVTALAVTATIAAPATGVDGQRLTLRIKDNGSAQTLSWTITSGGYRIVGTTLPTTTTAGKVLYVGCIYNSQDTFWDVVALSQQA